MTRTEKDYTYLDYNAIQEESHRIDCTISAAYFSMAQPNPHRIEITAWDINKYLKHTTGGAI
ncbi:MAG: hypothetical protein PHE51_03510 [Eubacteriales bacterium]|nr:hypothetical protein [Eubacteriales bacterium]